MACIRPCTPSDFLGSVVLVFMNIVKPRARTSPRTSPPSPFASPWKQTDDDAADECHRIRTEIEAALRIQDALRPRLKLSVRRGKRFSSAPDIVNLEELLIIGTRPQVLAALTIQRSTRPYLAGHCGRMLHSLLQTGECQVAAVERLLAAKANIEYRLDGDGETPLLVASRTMAGAAVSLLIEAGAQTENADSDGFTPLLWASYNGLAAVVRMLCEASADIHAVDNDGNTPIIVAALAGRETAVQVLCDAGASTDARNHCGMTALAVARAQGHSSIAALLAGDGATQPPASPAPPASRDPIGMNEALYWAAAKGQLTDVQRLIKAKADLESVQHASGMTPLLVACRNNRGANREPIVRALLEAGASTQSSRRDGSTPLMLCIQEQQDLRFNSLIQLLVDFGVDIHVKRNDGKTAYDLAVDLGREVGAGDDTRARLAPFKALLNGGKAADTGAVRILGGFRTYTTWPAAAPRFVSYATWAGASVTAAPGPGEATPTLQSDASTSSCSSTFSGELE